jgi:DNA-binding response OmpR family regulator
MPQNPYRFLLLDPNFVTRIALTSRLEASGFMVRAEKAVSTAARAATSSNWDLVIASASLAAPDLEAFLETLAMTDSKAIRCVVLEAEDRVRKEIAERFHAKSVAHPVRPQTLAELLPARKPGAEGPAEPSPFFRTA